VNVNTSVSVYTGLFKRHKENHRKYSTVRKEVGIKINAQKGE